MPSGYVRCKYLESSGTQWIDTKWKWNTKNIRIVSKVYFAAFGNIAPSALYDNDYYGITPYNSDDYPYMRVFLGPKNVLDINSISFRNAWVDLELKTESGKVYVNCNGKYAEKDYYYDSVCNLTSYIFARNSNGVATILEKSKYSFLQICNSGELQLDFIPALDPSGRPCMYDTVTKKPFYNQDTGEFGYELMNGTYVAPQ